MSFSSSELDFLLDDASSGEAVTLAGGLPLTKASMLSDLATLRSHWPDQARAIVELVTARRRLAAKFVPLDPPAVTPRDVTVPDSPAAVSAVSSQSSSPFEAQRWFTDSDAAQQATPAAVAQFRAAELARMGMRQVADVTCSIGTEVVACTAAGLNAVGSDLDTSRLRMARANGAPVFRADATQPALSADVDVVIADPARRNSSGRVSALADLQPPLPPLAQVYGEVGIPLAVKCAPGIDFDAVADWGGRIDVASVDGEVKEACVYSKDFGDSGQLLRRAVVIRDGQVTVWHSDMDHESDDDAAAALAGRFIIDPDGAIVRAGLVRHYAAAHGLWQLDPRIAYLTGDEIPAGQRGFEILERVPLKQLKSVLKARGVSSLEILVRGVDIDPDQLRKKLKLSKSKSSAEPASVVITREGTSAVAYVCRTRRNV